MFRNQWWGDNIIGIFIDSGKRGFSVEIYTPDIERLEADPGIDKYFDKRYPSIVNVYSGKSEKTPKYFIEALSNILPKIKGLTYNQCINRFQDPSISPNSI